MVSSVSGLPYIVLLGNMHLVGIALLSFQSNANQFNIYSKITFRYEIKDSI